MRSESSNAKTASSPSCAARYSSTQVRLPQFSLPTIGPSPSSDNCAKIRNGGKKGAKGKAAEAEGMSSPITFRAVAWLT